MKELHRTPDVPGVTLDIGRQAGDTSKALTENDKEAGNQGPHQ